MKKTIAEWESEYKSVGENAEYEPEQIEEYYRYIQMCKMMHEAELNNKKDETDRNVMTTL